MRLRAGFAADRRLGTGPPPYKSKSRYEFLEEPHLGGECGATDIGIARCPVLDCSKNPVCNRLEVRELLRMSPSRRANRRRRAQAWDVTSPIYSFPFRFPY